MGNNICKCQVFDSGNKSEKNLSREYTPKTSSKYISLNMQNNNLSGLNSTKNFHSFSKYRNIDKNNISTSNITNQFIIYNNDEKNKINEYEINAKNVNIEDNKYKNELNHSLYDDIKNYNDNQNIINNNNNNSNINIEDNKLQNNNNLLKNNKTKNGRNSDEVYKILLFTQSTKKLNESDLNSIIRKPTLKEYK